VVMRKQS